MNFTVGNIVKRIFHIIREECAHMKLSLKDHHALPSMKGLPKDTIRLDSLKSITMQKRQQAGLDGEESFPRIDEENVEDEGNENTPASGNATTSGSTSKRIGSGLNLRAQTSTSSSSHPGGSINLYQTLQNNLITKIDDLMEDIENVRAIISEQAKEHIHSNDVILTYGQSSNALINFFKEAAESLFFEVVVCESAPSYSGQVTAKTLAEQCGINTTLIPDSAVFALMSRVDKVIIGTHAIMANGGLITQTGAYMIALAA
jgi:translation initiation factor eIF-2B subunit beta